MAQNNNTISFPTHLHQELRNREIPPQISSPKDPINAGDDWVSCWVASDVYSRTMVNVKFLLRRDATSLTDTVEEWITFANPRDRFTSNSLGYVADTWPQIVDAYVPGSPYSAAGMVAVSSRMRPDQGIVLDEANRQKWVRYWYPTLSMNLQVHNSLPETGVQWLWLKVWATEIAGGRMDVQILIADVERVVASGYLSVMVVEQERNQRAKPRGKSKI